MIKTRLVLCVFALVLLFSFSVGQQPSPEPSFAGSGAPPTQGSPPTPDPKGTSPPEEPEPQPSGTHPQIQTAPRPIGTGTMILMGILLVAVGVIALTSLRDMFLGKRIEE